MSKQVDLIGSHPGAESHYGRWFSVNDIPHTATKCHRELTEQSSIEISLIETIARSLIEYHYTDRLIDKLKQRYTQLGFSKFANQHRKLPNDPNVQKGNLVEVMLQEYIQASLKKDLIKVYKLRYNPNVDQAMKGDDSLMVDLFDNNGIEKIKVYLGEAKFRKTPDRSVVLDITKSLNKDALPLSYSYMIEEIAKEDAALACKLEDYIIEDIKSAGDITYVGMLTSSTDTSRFVEANLSSDNANLIFISAGIGNPQAFVDAIYAKAMYLINNPDKL